MNDLLEDRKNAIEKSDAINILDRTIDFIRNCDNKASIFLGTFGVILTIVLTTDGLNSLIAIINSATTQITFCNILYLILLAISIITIVLGLAQIIKVLDANVDFSKDAGLDSGSKIFFEHISKNTYLDYKRKLSTMSDDEFINDITSQIYINSKICSQKYCDYKCGFKWSLIGFSFFIISWIIGVIVF